MPIQSSNFDTYPPKTLGISGYSGFSGLGLSGYSGFSGISGYSGCVIPESILSNLDW